jgi:hypothetical protein
LLRAAGHDQINGILQDLYGQPAKFQRRPLGLKPFEERRLQQWRALSTADRKALDHLLDRLSATPPPARRTA